MSFAQLPRKTSGSMDANEVIAEVATRDSQSQVLFNNWRNKGIKGGERRVLTNGEIAQKFVSIQVWKVAAWHCELRPEEAGVDLNRSALTPSRRILLLTTGKFPMKKKASLL